MGQHKQQNPTKSKPKKKMNHHLDALISHKLLYKVLQIYRLVMCQQEWRDKSQDVHKV